MSWLRDIAEDTWGIYGPLIILVVMMVLLIPMAIGLGLVIFGKGVVVLAERATRWLEANMP